MTLFLFWNIFIDALAICKANHHYNKIHVKWNTDWEREWDRQNERYTLSFLPYLLCASTHTQTGSPLVHLSDLMWEGWYWWVRCATIIVKSHSQASHIVWATTCLRIYGQQLKKSMTGLNIEVQVLDMALHHKHYAVWLLSFINHQRGQIIKLL